MIQIQPEIVKGEDYLALAENMGLLFEILDFSMGVPATKDAVRWYKDTGKVRSFHGVFIDLNPVSNDRDIAEISKTKYNESCRIAKKTGAENIVFHSTCYPNLRGGYLDVWAGRTAEFMTELSELYGINVYVENSFDVDPEPLRALMSRIRTKNIGVCLDIGHVNLSRRPVDAWFDALGDNVKYLHLSDNFGNHDGHITLGSGTAEVKRTSELCRFLGDVPMTLEVGGIDSIVASLRYIKENSLFGM